jgi:nucleotide-binding universal stress UspA family protein
VSALALPSRGAPAGEPPDPAEVDVHGVLLATEDREIPRAAVDFAARLAKRAGAPVVVFAVARVWGTSFGFPNPGLYPSKKEWDTQRENVDRAIRLLKRRGVEAEGHVIGTRAAAKRIVRAAQQYGCDVIVMGADEQRGRVRADLMWSQEPYRVRRRAPMPVYLIKET